MIWKFAIPGVISSVANAAHNIVEAILAESAGRVSIPPVNNLPDMNDFLLDIQQVARENAYYFWHHAQLSQLSPKISESQQKVYHENVSILTGAFETFRQDRLIREEDYPGEYRRIIDMLLLSGIYWLPFCALQREQRSEMSFQHHAWGLLHTVLTESGKDILRNVIGLSLASPVDP